jgi:hypothetical protein
LSQGIDGWVKVEFAITRYKNFLATRPPVRLHDFQFSFGTVDNSCTIGGKLTFRRAAASDQTLDSDVLVERPANAPLPAAPTAIHTFACLLQRCETSLCTYVRSAIPLDSIQTLWSSPRSFRKRLAARRCESLSSAKGG